MSQEKDNLTETNPGRHDKMRRLVDIINTLRLYNKGDWDWYRDRVYRLILGYTVSVKEASRHTNFPLPEPCALTKEMGDIIWGWMSAAATPKCLVQEINPHRNFAADIVDKEFPLTFADIDGKVGRYICNCWPRYYFHVLSREKVGWELISNPGSIDQREAETFREADHRYKKAPETKHEAHKEAGGSKRESAGASTGTAGQVAAQGRQGGRRATQGRRRRVLLLCR